MIYFFNTSSLPRRDINRILLPSCSPHLLEMGQVVNYALGSAQVFGKSKSAYYVKDPFVYLMLHTWYNHPVHFYEFYNFVLHYLHHPDLYPPVGRSRSA